MTRSTYDGVTPVDVKRPLWERRLGTALLALFVLGGAAGFLGDAQQTVTASEDGYTLTLTYPRFTRAGLGVPWELEVTSRDGFPQPVEIAVTGDYFDIYDHQALSPAAASQSADENMAYWTFEPPPGDTLSISIDQYVEPGAKVGASGTVALYLDGELAAPIDFTTQLLP